MLSLGILATLWSSIEVETSAFQAGVSTWAKCVKIRNLVINLVFSINTINLRLETGQIIKLNNDTEKKYIFGRYVKKTKSKQTIKKPLGC